MTKFYCWRTVDWPRVRGCLTAFNFSAMNFLVWCLHGVKKSRTREWYLQFMVVTCSTEISLEENDTCNWRYWKFLRPAKSVMRGGTCPNHIIFPSFCRTLILLTHLLFWFTAIRTDSYNAATLHFIDGPPNISLPTVVQTLPGLQSDVFSDRNASDKHSNTEPLGSIRRHDKHISGCSTWRRKFCLCGHQQVWIRLENVLCNFFG